MRINEIIVTYLIPILLPFLSPLHGPAANNTVLDRKI
jgi:hypothetical protein